MFCGFSSLPWVGLRCVHVVFPDHIYLLLGLFCGIFFKFGLNIMHFKNEEPDQMPHSSASDLGMHCLVMPHKTRIKLI